MAQPNATDPNPLSDLGKNSRKRPSKGEKDAKFLNGLGIIRRRNGMFGKKRKRTDPMILQAQKEKEEAELKALLDQQRFPRICRLPKPEKKGKKIKKVEVVSSDEEEEDQNDEDYVYSTAYGKRRKKGSGKKATNKRRTCSKRKEKESDGVERYKSDFEEDKIPSGEELTDFSDSDEDDEEESGPEDEVVERSMQVHTNIQSSSNSQNRQSLENSLPSDEGAYLSNPRVENRRSRNDEELIHENLEANLMNQQHQHPPQPVSVAEDKRIDGSLMEAHGLNDLVVPSDLPIPTKKMNRSIDLRQCEQCHQSIGSEALVAMKRLQAADNHAYCLQCFDCDVSNYVAVMLRPKEKSKVFWMYGNPLRQIPFGSGSSLAPPLLYLLVVQPSTSQP